MLLTILKKALVIGVCFFVFFGCTDPKKEAILLSIKQIEQKKDLLTQSMIGQQQKISNIELQKNPVNEEIRTFNGKIEAYMMNHKIALACMGAAGVTLDEKNEYSDDVKGYAALGGLLCIAGLFDADFRKEVFEVVDQLNQADSHKKNLKAQLADIQSQLDTANVLLEQEKTEFSKLDANIQQYQCQLAALDNPTEIPNPTLCKPIDVVSLPVAPETQPETQPEPVQTPPAQTITPTTTVPDEAENNRLLEESRKAIEATIIGYFSSLSNSDIEQAINYWDAPSEKKIKNIKESISNGEKYVVTNPNIKKINSDTAEVGIDLQTSINGKNKDWKLIFNLKIVNNNWKINSMNELIP